MMMATDKGMNREKLERILDPIFSGKVKNKKPLSELVRFLASTQKSPKNLLNTFDQFINLLEGNAGGREVLKKYLRGLFTTKNASRTLALGDMISSENFSSEVSKRISQKFLPDIPLPGSVESILTPIFTKKSQSKWLDLLDEDRLKNLVNVLDFDSEEQSGFIKYVEGESLHALEILAHQISGIAYDKYLIGLILDNAVLRSPFAVLHDEIYEFIKCARDQNCRLNEHVARLERLREHIDQCEEFVKKAYENVSSYGLSFMAQQKLLKMERMLDRMGDMTAFLTSGRQGNFEEVAVEFSKKLIFLVAGQSQLSTYVNASTQAVSKEIIRHIAIKGEQYITFDKEGYYKMLRAALWGGAIVAVACLSKLLMGYASASLFGKAFMYSMNYAVAFIAIYLFHFTLATKQPAMTAVALAKAVGANKDGSEFDFSRLATLISHMFRSQFIAFVGNVFMAFPVALLLIILWWAVFGTNPATAKAGNLIHELNIIKSPAIFHACIAGVFLFISGLIAGRVNNRIKYSRLPKRVEEQFMLKRLLSSSARKKLAQFIDHNWSGVVSNFWFGVFMGSTASLGAFFGLDLDIRHITFAAGNFALGLFGQSFQMSGYDVFHSILGVGVIGFCNFIVSFSLSLFLAMRSNGLYFSHLITILVRVLSLFVRRPVSFFFPER